MSARDRHEFQYQRRLAAEQDDAGTDAEARPDRRFEHQSMWVDLQIRAAMERGEFDNLPGAGKPIPGDDRPHDPQWWVKQLIQRENITGVLPPALGLRREDAELDDRLDAQGSEQRVREIVDDFNQRIVEARRQLQGGPPVITSTRDLEEQVDRWRARRATRVRTAQSPTPPAHRRWFRR